MQSRCYGNNTPSHLVAAMYTDMFQKVADRHVARSCKSHFVSARLIVNLWCKHFDTFSWFIFMYFIFYFFLNYHMLSQVLYVDKVRVCVCISSAPLLSSSLPGERNALPDCCLCDCHDYGSY